MAGKKTKEGTFGAIRATLRDHALENAVLPSTGKLLVAFEGMPWVGVLEITESGGVRAGKWRNVSTMKPY